MRIVITGGTGFVGRKLAERLLRDGAAEAPGGGRETHLGDRACSISAEPHQPLPSDPRLKLVTGNLADPAQIEALITPQTGSIYHFAAVVSAGAEADLDLGYAVNVDGTRHVLNACRKLPSRRAWCSPPPELSMAASCRSLSTT